MPRDPAKLLDLVIAAAVFVLVLALWFEMLLVWLRYRLTGERRVRERLQPTADVDEDPTRLRVLRLWHQARRSGSEGKGPRRRAFLLGYFDRLAVEAGWDLPGHALLIGLAGATLMVFVIAFALTGRGATSVLAGVACPVVFHLAVQARITRREALFESQLLDALQLMSGSLRAGHPLGGAFRYVSMEVGPPVGELFGDICQQQALGVGLEDALRRAAEKAVSPDLRMFATAVAVQLRSGGNLADMMGRLSSVIRDRIRVNRRLRVVTAQARLGKRVLAAMPFVILLGMNFLKPEYLEPLYNTPTGNVLLATALGALVLGVVVMNKMTVVRY